VAETPMRDYAFLYAPAWDSPTRFSKHHLAAYLARRGNRVLYEEAPLTALAARRGRQFLRELRETWRPLRQVEQNLWIARHFLPLPYHSATAFTSTRTANRIGQRILAPRLRSNLAQLGFAMPTLVAGLPHVVDALPHVRWRTLIYHCADDYAHVRGFPSSLPRLEEELCRRADLVVTTSETLCEQRRRFNPHTYWIPNGVDVEHFAASVEPAAELLSIQPPIIGFIGGLSQWVNIELIAAIARARPRWSIVLVGPIGVDISALRGLPNVYLLGARPYAQTPAYLAAMDVALIPFRQEPVTYHADPIKAYEYLAAGVAVVATDLPALRRLQHVIALADSPDSFVEQVEAAIQAGRDRGRRERQLEATKHSWTARFVEWERLLACAS
jgi:glycosyltransferase involved in cell wall biosynthesis